MSLLFIGPVDLDLHGNPSFNWQGPISATGLRPMSISGLVSWDEAKAIQELVANPDRRISFAGEVGVLEVIWAGDELQRDYNGWSLLQSCDIDANQRDSLNDFVPFDVSAVHLGSREPVITRSARARDDDFGLVARPLAVQPFWGEDEDGEPFATNPGGTVITREYDPRTAYDPESPTTAGRELRIHIGTVT